MILLRVAALSAVLTLAACGRAEPPREAGTPPPTAAEPVVPAAPGTPGGLPDDRTPLAEGPTAPQSAQGAGQVVQSYFALLESGRYAEARKLWTEGGRASGATPEGFAARFAAYESYHANIGAPGRIEGAAGSLYVAVPVQVYGRLETGAPMDVKGEVKLRRSNDVPGSTPEQRAWRIVAVDVPTPG
jgi:hypothetical protein